MEYKLNADVTLDFTTHHPVTGNVSDADVLPTCDIFEDTTDAAMVSPVVVKRAGHTGDYRVNFTTDALSGFEINKSYNVIVTATVGGITAKSRISAFTIVSAGAAAQFKL